MLESDERLLNSYIENLTKQDVVCLTISSPNFPTKFMGIKDSPIMILDDSVSAVDVKTEETIIQNILNLAKAIRTSVRRNNRSKIFKTIKKFK